MVTTLGVDVGGTFTDVALWKGREQRLVLTKVPSTPENQSRGFVDGIRELGYPLSDIERIVHGTTVGTNAMIQGRGARVGLVTTSGFRDLIEIGRTQRLVQNSMFNPRFVRPRPLVPRHLRFEIDERTLASGAVLKAPDPEDLRIVADELLREKVDSVAVCLLHSYRTRGNEDETGRILRRLMPGTPVCLSSDVIPEYREYERFSSTVVNAYLMPMMIHYLSSLERELSDLGYPKTLFIMNSSGGMISSRTAQLFPVRTIVSGPAGGVNGAIYLARQAGFPNIITYDMGGTSSDVCLVKNLNPMVSLEHRFSGIPVKTLQMEINTIGAGGGSIAWVDSDGRLKVGPQSAGSVPGPAGYGKGGREVTITDANLVLGRLGGNSLLAGKVRLFEDFAAAAMKRLSERLGGIEPMWLAEGVIQISVAKMSSAIKEISVEKGHDPRDYVLFPYGGAGPMHATLIAEELGIGSILVPRSPGNLSALGLIISDVRMDDVASWLVCLDELDMDGLYKGFRAMEGKAAALLGKEGFTREAIEYQRSLDLRYKGQAFELNIPMTDGGVEAIKTRFHARFHETYGHGNLNHRIELVNFRLTSFGKVEKPSLEPYGCGGRSIDLAKKSERDVYFKGRFQSTAVFEREKLPSGVVIDGPCIIEENGATSVVSPGWNARIDAYGNLVLKRR